MLMAASISVRRTAEGGGMTVELKAHSSLHSLRRYIMEEMDGAAHN